MVAHNPQTPGGNRDVEGQVAGLVTWVEIRLIDCDVINGQETSEITARHVIPGKSDDTLDVVALVDMDRQPRGHRSHGPAERRALVRTRDRRRSCKNAGAVEDDKVPSSQR
jgi:hypothetical protein